MWFGFGARACPRARAQPKQVSKLFADSCCITLTAFISPFRADRAVAREKRLAEVRAGAVVRPVDGPAAQEGTSFGEMIMYVGTAFLLVIGISLGAAWLMMQYFGDK